MNSPSPVSEGFGLDLELGMITMVAGPMLARGILVGRALHPARRHQPQVRAVAHAVRGEGVVDGAVSAAVESDVQRDRLGASYSRSRCWSRKAGWPRPRAGLPRPRRRARSRCRTPRPPLLRAYFVPPLTQTRMSALRGVVGNRGCSALSLHASPVPGNRECRRRRRRSQPRPRR